MLTYKDRIKELIHLIVGETPPEYLITNWLDDTEDPDSWDTIQNWIGETGGGPWWIQNIGILDMVRAGADAPVEGEPELIDYNREDNRQ